MKTTVMIGAGQMGRAAAELLHPNRVQLLAFGDNDSDTWTREAETPVLPVEEALALQPQQAVISVMGEERARSLSRQVRELGYGGRILFLRDICDLFDLRSRCIRQLADRIRQLEIPGQIAELGVYRGDTAWQLNALFPDRKLYLFDTFEGFDPRDVQQEQEKEKADGSVGSYAKAGQFSDTEAETVLLRMPFPEQVILRQGYFPDTAVYEQTGETAVGPAFALVSLDPDLYAPTIEGLRYFYPRMSRGGMIIVHDYNNRQFEGVRKAVLDFETDLLQEEGQPLQIVPLGDLHGSVVIVRQF